MKVQRIIVSAVALTVRLFIALFLVLLIYRAALVAYNFGYRVFSEPAVSGPPGVDVSVTIPVGADSGDIGRILKNAGLITDDRLFILQERLSGHHDKLQPGTYTLNTSETAEEMMAIMARDEEDGTEGGEAE